MKLYDYKKLKFIKLKPLLQICIPSIAFLYLASQGFKNRGKKFPFRGLYPYELRRVTSGVKNREEQCRNIFERIFSIPFRRVRPEFLVNPETNHRLELDGFAPDIPTKYGKGVAFEYNGSQHYFYQPRFHQSSKDFEAQKRRDNVKRQICKKMGIILIVIPYTITDAELEHFIRQQLCKHGLYYYIHN